MDVLGAIALGTEAPRVDADSRISRKDKIITPFLWRSIICMSIYQITIMVIFMYFGQMMFFKKSFNLVTAPLRDERTDKALDPLKLDTILFYIFIVMNLFNQFNCRIVDEGRYNVVVGVWRNMFFVLVLAFEFFLTWAMVDIGATTLGSSLIGTAEITAIDHLCIWCIGSTTLIWGAILKKIPLRFFEKISNHVNLEEEDDENDHLNKLFNKASEMHNKARASIGIPGEGHTVGDDSTLKRSNMVDDSKEPEDDSE